MDISPQDTTLQPISDDQELAKALAGVLPEEPEEVRQPNPVPPLPGATTDPGVIPTLPVPALPTPSAPPVAPVVAPAAPASDALDTIKKDVLDELRPLVDKVNLPAEEKFDIYLLLIRSTDDSSLVAAAHTAAQAITDEKRRAEALLDIIKEIDYLSRKDQPAV